MSILKKLDLLVIRGFIGPFLVSTFVMLLILIFQFLWMFIDDLIGKGLNIFVLIKLIAYTSATLLPLCLPVGVLFASLISFGSMGEHFELVAIKASGISFRRFLQPILWLGVVISILAFLFANYAIPYANKRYNTLFYSIMAKKPALNLKEGTFYDKIDNYIIRAKSKSKDGSILYDMIIIEKNKDKPEFDNIIVAKKGFLDLTDNGDGLIFNLFDGYYYQEKEPEKSDIEHGHNDFYRVAFKEYVRVLKVQGFRLVESKNDSKDYRTMRLNEIEREIEHRKHNFYITRQFLHNSLRTHMPILLWVDTPKISRYMPDTATQLVKKIQGWFADKDRIYSSRYLDYKNQVSEAASFLTSIFNGFYYDRERLDQGLNRMKIEWHKKFSLSFSCFVFIIIGGALGAVIRKGGIGLPLLIAVSFFVFYYFSSASLERIAVDPQGMLNPFFALWLANMFLLPLGIYLAYKVLNDAQIMNLKYYYKLLAILHAGKKYLPKIHLFKRKAHKTQ